MHDFVFLKNSCFHISRTLKDLKCDTLCYPTESHRQLAEYFFPLLCCNCSFLSCGWNSGRQVQGLKYESQVPHAFRSLAILSSGLKGSTLHWETVFNKQGNYTCTYPHKPTYMLTTSLNRSHIQIRIYTLIKHTHTHTITCRHTFIHTHTTRDFKIQSSRLAVAANLNMPNLSILKGT